MFLEYFPIHYFLSLSFFSSSSFLLPVMALTADLTASDWGSTPGRFSRTLYNQNIYMSCP